LTALLPGTEIAAKLEQEFPEGIVESSENNIIVNSESLLQIASFLKTAPELHFDYLNSITAVDYHSHFEVVYHLTSTVHNHSLVLKVRVDDRKNPVIPSIVSLWYGADFQEREIYDLFGIRFEGHPNMKRIFLWEGFPGNPLRKDYQDAS